MSQEYYSDSLHQYRYKNIVLDTLSKKITRGVPISPYGINSFSKYDDSVLSDNSQYIKLDPSEDACLKLSRNGFNIPLLVKNWNPLSIFEKKKKVFESESGKMFIILFRLVATNADTAWLEIATQSYDKISSRNIAPKVTTFDNIFNYEHKRPDYVSIPLFLKTTFNNRFPKFPSVRSTVDNKDVSLFVLFWKSYL